MIARANSAILKYWCDKIGTSVSRNLGNVRKVPGRINVIRSCTEIQYYRDSEMQLLPSQQQSVRFDLGIGREPRCLEDLSYFGIPLS